MNQRLPVFIGAILLFATKGCSKPKIPTYVGYQNFRLAKAGLSNNVLATDIKLYNPNSYPLKLKSASVDVYFNDRFLGHTSLDSLIILPATDTAVIPVRMNASVKDLFSHTAQLLLNPDVKIRMTGSAKAGRGSIFISIPIDWEGVHRIELFGKN